MHFLNKVANDTESTQKSKLRHNRKFEERNNIEYQVSSLPGSALRMYGESLGKPRDVNKHSQSLAW